VTTSSDAGHLLRGVFPPGTTSSMWDGVSGSSPAAFLSAHLLHALQHRLEFSIPRSAIRSPELEKAFSVRARELSLMTSLGFILHQVPARTIRLCTDIHMAVHHNSA
jgi:hypothetical protein